MRPYYAAIRYFLECHGNYKALLEEALHSWRGGPIGQSAVFTNDGALVRASPAALGLFSFSFLFLFPFLLPFQFFAHYI